MAGERSGELEPDGVGIDVYHVSHYLCAGRIDDSHARMLAEAVRYRPCARGRRLGVRVSFVSVGVGVCFGACERLCVVLIDVCLRDTLAGRDVVRALGRHAHGGRALGRHAHGGRAVDLEDYVAHSTPSLRIASTGTLATDVASAEPWLTRRICRCTSIPAESCRVSACVSVTCTDG